MQKENQLTSCLTSPLAGSCGRRKGEGDQRENTLLSPLIGFECSRTQNHFPRGAARRVGSQTAGGFTLIELLVVVLIIGILAAVALPQYTKAVEKSKATQAITMLKSLGQAEMAYHLASGSFAEKFEDLDIDVPFAEDTTSAFSANITDTRANEDWSFQLNPSYKLIAARRLSGKYQGNGFFLYITGSGSVLDGKLRCIETTGEAGQYCVKVFGATLGYQVSGLREYDMN